jgi:DNA-binding CsgD family transcriptional regulator
MTQPRLTPREYDVLVGLSEGLTNERISRKLLISPDTAKMHIQRLYRALGARDRAHAVSLGYQFGVLVVESCVCPRPLGGVA